MYYFRLLIIFSLSTVFAQDSWLVNELFQSEYKEENAQEKKVHFEKSSSLYQIDITGDSKKEFIRSSIKDGIPHLEVFNFDKEKVFTHKFPISGFDSYIYRIRTRPISRTRKLVLFYLYDGKTSYQNLFGSSSLWGIVVENGELSNLKISSFGTIWIENQDNYGHYKRAHHIQFEDIDKNGQKDIIISSGSVIKRYSYDKDGKWLGL